MADSIGSNGNGFDARHKAIMRAIRDHKSEFNGCAPSLADIKRRACISSESEVRRLLGQLQAAGEITVHEGLSRMIEVSGTAWGDAT